MKWNIHVVIYLGSIQNGAKAIMEENNLDRSRQQRETKNELDGKTIKLLIKRFSDISASKGENEISKMES